MKRTFWEEHGKQLYQMGPNPVRTYIIDKIKSLDAKKVLDVGCGSGPIYDLLEQEGWEWVYVGTDYSGAFIETCQKHFPDALWIEDDMRELWQFNDNEFDFLLYLHSLDHVDKWLDALDNAYRVSNKYVMIVLWRPFAQGKINTSHHAEYEDSHLTEFNKEELEDYMTKIGFKIIESREMYHGKQYNYIYLLEK